MCVNNYNVLYDIYLIINWNINFMCGFKIL